jgi:hypothetical protein
MVVSSAELGPDSDCSGKAHKQMYKQITDHPLVREGDPHQETRNLQKEKENLVMDTKWEPDTKTNLPNDRRS